MFFFSVSGDNVARKNLVRTTLPEYSVANGYREGIMKKKYVQKSFVSQKSPNILDAEK